MSDCSITLAYPQMDIFLSVRQTFSYYDSESKMRLKTKILMKIKAVAQK